jgi:hypothetical protein
MIQVKFTSEKWIEIAEDSKNKIQTMIYSMVYHSGGTLEHILEMSMLDCVQYYFPKVTKKEADYILWEDTCYPFSTDEILNQLWELYNKYSQKTLKENLKKVFTSF